MPANENERIKSVFEHSRIRIEDGDLYLDYKETTESDGFVMVDLAPKPIDAYTQLKSQFDQWDIPLFLIGDNHKEKDPLTFKFTFNAKAFRKLKDIEVINILERKIGNDPYYLDIKMKAKSEKTKVSPEEEKAAIVKIFEHVEVSVVDVYGDNFIRLIYQPPRIDNNNTAVLNQSEAYALLDKLFNKTTRMFSSRATLFSKSYYLFTKSTIEAISQDYPEIKACLREKLGVEQYDSLSTDKPDQNEKQQTNDNSCAIM